MFVTLLFLQLYEASCGQWDSSPDAKPRGSGEGGRSGHQPADRQAKACKPGTTKKKSR